MSAAGSAPTLSADRQADLDLALKCYSAAEPRHTHHRKRWEHFYRLFRSYKDTKRQYADARGSQRDVDEVLRSATAGFGADLFIPYVFSTIETIVPRMLSNNPTLLLEPADPKSEDNTEGMKLILTRQQARTGFALTAQDIVKDGCIYGLGVAKTHKVRETVSAPVLERASVPAAGKEWVVGDSREKVLYEGPRVDVLDPFDFLWDPDASNIETAEFVIHRTWRTEDYVRKMLKGKDSPWSLPKGWTIEDVLSGGSRSKKDEIWAERSAAGGIDMAGGKKEREIHEVWEVHSHSGAHVTTVLDRHCPVQSGDNPYWHRQKPFQIYRPTRVPHEFVGIGEAEAMEDLAEEMNELRTGRRNNAALAMQRPIAYMDGMLTPSQISFAPGMMWPVDGDPNQVMNMIQVPDIPFSSYREEDNLKADIERVSGIDDSSSGVGGAEQTATGTQLVQAAANVRIVNKAKLFEKETAKRCCEQMLSINQQFIIEEQVISGPPKPDEAHREFSWYKVGPAELAGTWAIEPDAGSMSPQNEATKRQEGVVFMQTFGPLQGVTDPMAVAKYALTEWGVRNPERFLVPKIPPIPPEVLEMVGETLIAEGRVAPDEFAALVMEAEQQVAAAAQAAEQTGPGGMPGQAPADQGTGAPPAPAGPSPAEPPPAA